LVTVSEDAISAREVYLIRKKLKRLTIENQILKQSLCTEFSPLEEKLKAIERLKDDYSIHSLCDTLCVRRSTFYHYLYRRPKQTLIEKEDEIYKENILETQSFSNTAYPYDNSVAESFFASLKK
jgi:hypothetical protein